MFFALELTDLLPVLLGGTATLALTILESLLVAILLLILLLWGIQKLATRHDPPNDPMKF